MRIHNVSEENRKLLSDKAKKQWQDPVWRAKTLLARQAPEAQERSRLKRKGLKRSQETKDKIRLAHLGKKQSMEVIAARVARNTGLKRSQEFIDNRSGEKNPRYKHGNDSGRKFLTEWKKEVRNIYPFCIKCNTDLSLISHHVENVKDFPEKRFVVKNGVTLCRSCHSRFHRLFGARFTNREKLNGFLSLIT